MNQGLANINDIRWRMWLIAMMLVLAGLCFGSPSPSLQQEKGGTSDSTPFAIAPDDSAHQEASVHLLPLMDDFWHWRAHDSPELATQVGVNDNTAGRLDSFTPEHFTKRKKKSEEFLEKVNKVDQSNLTSTEKVNLEIFKYQLRTMIQNHKFSHYPSLVTALEGPQLQFSQMVDHWMTLDSYNDFQKLLSRYGEFSRQADEIIKSMENNIDDKIMPYNESLTGILDQFENLKKPVSQSIFFKPFLHLPLYIDPDQRTSLREQAQKRISQDLFPAFDKIKDFLMEKYIPKARKTAGAFSLPNGEEYYKACLHYHTSTNLSPQDIHNLGVTEVKRIQTDLIEISKDLGIEDTDYKTLMNRLRESEQSEFNNAEEAAEMFQKTSTEVALPHMKEIFTFLPIENLTVKIEDWGPIPSPIWYERPSFDDTRPGTIYINPNNLSLISQNEVTAASLHLSYPGHHYHASVLQSSASIPIFRKVFSQSRLANVPSKFPYHSVFIEGWALYSEYLGEELNLYTDPYQRFGRISRESMAAARLVVDTGIHALGWSWNQGLRYFKENTPLSDSRIWEELKRIVTWPGQSCASKVGEIKIKELRQRAANALGSTFELKKFHDVLLQCTGPLYVLQDCISEYISQNIQRPTERPTERPISTTNVPHKTSSDESTNSGNNIYQSGYILLYIYLVVYYILL